MSLNDFKLLIYSMMTASAVGIAIALLCIYTFSYFFAYPSNATSNPVVFENISDIIHEEDKDDPTFISRFSRTVVYSTDDSREIIEQAQNSLVSGAKKKVTSSSYVVANLGTNMNILEKEIDTLKPIASVTKLITAVMARKLIDQDEYITITKEMTNTYGNQGKLRVGEKLRASELLYPLLIVSSNDAAEALAMAYAGGRKEFIEEMNDWVNSIGAYRTYFKDPSGLSSQNVSTAKDLLTITKWILSHDPGIFDLTLIKSKTIRTHTWTNATHFLNLSSYFGGKNGYTPEANLTSVSLFKIGRYDRKYAVVLLDSRSRDNDTLDLLHEVVK